MDDFEDDDELCERFEQALLKALKPGERAKVRCGNGDVALGRQYERLHLRCIV